VKVGNYLGKNHGRIKMIDESRVEVVEIVPDGKGNWVERPRTLALREKD
jgi:type IV pilus assembly protein PilP